MAAAAVALGAAAFNPASLFAASQKGAWYDPSDLSTLFQNSNGTTAVAVGDPVGYIGDKSGNGNHLIQATSSKRPILRQDENLRYYLSYDGVDDWLAFGSSPGFTSTMDVVLAYLYADVQTVPCADLQSGTKFFACSQWGSTSAAQNLAGSPTYSINDVVPLGAGSSTRSQFNVATLPGEPVVLTSYSTDMSGWTSLGIGDYAAYAGMLRFYGAIFRQAMSASEKASSKAFLASKCASDALAARRAAYADTQTPNYNLTNGYFFTSGNARLIFNTAATSITINAYTNIYGIVPSLATIGVEVDGAFYGSIAAPADGAFSGTISLPAGNKTVEIVNGEASISSGPPPRNGTFVISVSGNAPMAPVAPPARATNILFMGDSINSGSNGSPEQQYAGVLAVRRAAAALGTPQGVAYIGYGGARWGDISLSSTEWQSFVDRVALRAPQKLWFALGVNDYIAAVATAATWCSVSIGPTLDLLHSTLPSLTIYLQTPIVKAVETANAKGDTLGAWRTALAGLATGRAWLTIVDGTGADWPTTSDLSADGIHPNNAGQTKIGTAIRNVLGI